MATDMGLVLIGSRPPTRLDTQPSSSHPPTRLDTQPSSSRPPTHLDTQPSSSRPPTRLDTQPSSSRLPPTHRPSSQASSRPTPQPADVELKPDESYLYSTSDHLHDHQELQETNRSDLGDLMEEPSPSRTGIWVERNASYEDELFTNSHSHPDWSKTGQWEEPGDKSVREGGKELETEQRSNDNRLVPGEGSSKPALKGGPGPISSTEPQRVVAGTGIPKKSGSTADSSKPLSVGKSQSGKYLFRPLTSARTLNRNETVNIEGGIDRIIEKQMNSMFGKTFKKKIDTYVSTNDGFSGDISGKTAVLTDRPPSGRTTNQNARTNILVPEASEYNEGMGAMKYKRANNGENEFNSVHQDLRYDDASTNQLQGIGRQTLSSGTAVEPASRFSSSIKGLQGEQGGRATPSSTQGSSSYRPASARQRTRYRQTPSFVDETLFGDQLDYEAGFPSPWDTTPTHGERTRPIIFDCTDYRAKAEKENERSVNQRSRPQSRARTNSAQINTMRQRSNSVQSRPSSSLGNETVQRSKKARNVRPHVGGVHEKRHSYVDETLFGGPPEEAGWDAPWDKSGGKSRPRPHIFDPTDYRQKNEKRMEGSEKGLQGSSVKHGGSARNLSVWR